MASDRSGWTYQPTRFVRYRDRPLYALALRRTGSMPRSRAVRANSSTSCRASLVCASRAAFSAAACLVTARSRWRRQASSVLTRPPYPRRPRCARRPRYARCARRSRRLSGARAGMSDGGGRPADVGDFLTLRQLNRATLARQLLLERSAMSVPAVVEHLCGLQAQTTTTWYAGLWTRLTDFSPGTVVDLMKARELVRVVLMRSTIHLVTGRDCLFMRPLVQVASERSFAGNWGKNLPGVDLAEVVAVGREILEQTPLTFAALGKRLTEKWPDRDGPSMAQAVRVYVALVQPPPRGLWGHSGLAVHAPAEQWLGKPLDPDPSIETLMMRYLAA